MAKRSEIIRQGILDLYLNGTLRPRQPLSEQLLAEYFGVSRTPVREVIQQLLAEGILRQTAGGTSEFPGLTPKEVRDIYEIFEVLLLSSCDRLNQSADAEINRVKELFETVKSRDLKEAQTQKDVIAAYAHLFHWIIRQNGNEIAERFMEQMKLRIEQYFRCEWREVFPAEEGLGQALAILDAIAGRETEVIRQSIQDHLKWSCRLLLSHMMRY